MYFESRKELEAYLKGLKLQNDEILMILLGYKSSDEMPHIREFVSEMGVNYFGGIFPGLIVGNRKVKSGFIIEVFKPVFMSIVLPHMMRFKIDPATLYGCTALVLVDGLSSKIKELTDTVYEKMGNHVKYIGGGAGSFDMVQKPCIFDNKGIYKDVLYVCVLPLSCHQAVKHGWRKMNGPFKIDNAYENILSLLDNKNAFDVYREVVETEEQITLYEDNFYYAAKNHPFGILQDDGTVIVRDPIRINSDYEIVCVADIPEGDELYILKGDTDSLLSASLEIAEYCSSKAYDNYMPLLFDCISRVSFMEDRFEEELVNIQSKLKATLQGVLSISEISTKRNGQIVIHNKSAVLGLLK